MLRARDRSVTNGQKLGYEASEPNKEWGPGDCQRQMAIGKQQRD